MKEEGLKKQLYAGDEEILYEPKWFTNVKLGILILLTFGLIVAIFAMTNAIEMLAGSKAASFGAAGGIILALFVVYVLLFGVAWHFGASKRETLRREAVEKAIQKEKALQAINNLQ